MRLEEFLADGYCRASLNELGCTVVEGNRGLRGPSSDAKRLLQLLLDTRTVENARADLTVFKPSALRENLKLYIATRDGIVSRAHVDSPLMSSRGLPTRPAPGALHLEPPGGTFDKVVQVVWRAPSSAAQVRFTLDGSDPLSSSQLARGPVPVMRSSELAVAAFEDGERGPVVRARFELRVPPVTVVPPPGSYAPPHAITLRCGDPTATIRYTIDGSEPDEGALPYDSAAGLQFDQSVDLRARAFVDGWTPSEIVVAPFEVERPRWLVREPEDRVDPVDHDVTSRCTPDDSRWVAIGASVRGRLHAHRGGWREDAFAMEAAGRCLAMAVADGAGSSRSARVGSHVAVLTASRVVAEGIARSRLTADDPQEDDSEDLATIVLTGVHEARRALELEAADRGIELGALSTTLLVCAICTNEHGRTTIAAVQVGDGAVVVERGDGSTQVLGIADSGTYSGETLFLTSSAALEGLRERVVIYGEQNVRTVALMTDGVADDFFPASTKMRQLFHELDVATMGVVGAEERLLEWMRYEKAGSFDDRTLVHVRKVET